MSTSSFASLAGTETQTGQKPQDEDRGVCRESYRGRREGGKL